ncbi:putative reverse transcriptase domain-containing protein [Tanacetum coccineum]
MPKYAKFMKDILTQRGRGQSGINKALADLWASISLIPYSMLLRLNLGELKPTLEFVVLDMKEDHKIPIILGRPFLATAHAMIDVFNKKISFEVGNKTITFDLEKSMRFPPSDDDTCHSIDIINLSILDHVQEILPSKPFDSILFEPINHHLPTKINILWDDNKGEQDLINQISGDLEPKSKDYTKPTLFAANMFEGEKPTTKLKDLPSHLEYAFLDNNQEFPIIISSLLSSITSWGYFQIPLALEDQEKTTFTCPYGKFAYRRMPLGYGSENLADDHLSRLENPELEELDEDVIRDSPIGGHYGADNSARKVFEAGFYWPTIFKDSTMYVRECDACQRARNISTKNQMPLTNILVSEVFDI